MIRRRDQRRHTAVHEAGHAVVGRVPGLDCGSVTIEASRREMEAGHAVTAVPYASPTFLTREPHGIHMPAGAVAPYPQEAVERHPR